MKGLKPGRKEFDGMNYFSVIRVITAAMLSLLLVFAIIFLVSDEPVMAISKMMLGPFQTRRSFFNVIERGIPLVFTGLALNISLRSGVFNIGIDGSFYMGAVLATAVAIKVPLPNLVHQAVILIAAGVLGGCINMLPVLINRYTKINATVLSIMFNSVFYYFGLSIVSSYLLDKSGSWGSEKFPVDARFGVLIKGTSMNWSFIIVIAVILFVVLLMEKTSFGYKVRVTGINAAFAKSSGIKVAAVILGAQFIGGVIGGIGGAIEMVGMYKRFQWQSPVNFVWDGLMVHMMANENPVFIPLTALFIAYLRVGAEIMSRSTNLDPEIVAFLQGIIILLVTSERFLYFIKRHHDQRLALKNAETAKVEGGI
ncbi:MAG: ABC transporter permease [Hungatella sp.]|jgi:simple sugar transport system permease protein|nr:ABC transporter permease [Hungatella sp.]